MLHVLPVWLFAIGFHHPLATPSTFQQVSPQPKQEVETRIRPSEFPHPAAEWIAPVVAEARRIRHYLQTDGVDTSYEVKFKIDGQTWSVEFEEDGAFQDAERLTNPRSLPEGMRTHLDSRFKSWKIVRAQSQHQPDTESPARPDWFRTPSAPIGYEVEVEGRNADEIGRFELQFDSGARLLLERRILEIRLLN